MQKRVYSFALCLLLLGLALPLSSQVSDTQKVWTELSTNLQTLKQQTRDLRLALQTSQLSLMKAMDDSKALQMQLDQALEQSKRLGQDSMELTKQLQELKQELNSLESYIKSLENEKTLLVVGLSIAGGVAIVEGIILFLRR